MVSAVGKSGGDNETPVCLEVASGNIEGRPCVAIRVRRDDGVGPADVIVLTPEEAAALAEKIGMAAKDSHEQTGQGGCG